MEDNLLPTSKWQFDAEVTNCFDDMLKRSIPQYEVMRKAVFDMGSHYVKPGTHVVDLGCSRGEALVPFISHFGANNKYIGIDISLPMLEVARVRFKDSKVSELIDIIEYDLRNEFTITNTSLTLSILTFQFIPIEYRQPLLKKIYDNTVPGGAFILVEKVLGASPDIDQHMIDAHHHMKFEKGYSREQIERKKISLEGVLIPLSAKRNETLLETAGFTQTDCFWRWMNFAGWIAIKKQGA